MDGAQSVGIRPQRGEGFSIPGDRFLCPFGEESREDQCSHGLRCAPPVATSRGPDGAEYPQIALRSTRGYIPRPRWGRMNLQAGTEINAVVLGDGRKPGPSG